MAAVGMPELLILLTIAVRLAWYVVVLLLLWKIWTKVRHLPG